MPFSEPEDSRPVVMVVDDTPLNLHTLTEVLKPEFIVRPVPNGRLALKVASGRRPPDLILLDIMMPEMDGFEVMARLKANPETAHIPVIFVTALSSFGDEAKGLVLGAADYIAKPFSPPVVLARVRTQLALIEARRKLEAINARLLAERALVEEVLGQLRETENFDARYLNYRLSSVDRSNGDILLAALTPDGRQRVLVGDIAGHGPSAAVCAPLIGHLFYSATSTGSDLGALLATLGEVMYRRLPRQVFMVFALLEVSADRRRVRAWNGGLPGFLHVREGASTQSLPSRSLPLGLEDGAGDPAECLEAALRPGDRLILFTDGLSEAESPQGEPFGEERVRLLLEGACAPVRLDRLLAALIAHCGDVHFRDDLTVAEVIV